MELRELGKYLETQLGKIYQTSDSQIWRLKSITPFTGSAYFEELVAERTNSVYHTVLLCGAEIDNFKEMIILKGV